jgi:hypothetical protein
VMTSSGALDLCHGAVRRPQGMSYATLMVHIDLYGELGGHVEVAVDLAERFHAHLIGVAGWAPMSAVLADNPCNDPTSSETHLPEFKRLLDQRGREFCAAVGKGDSHPEWRSCWITRRRPLRAKPGQPIS